MPVVSLSEDNDMLFEGATMKPNDLDSVIDAWLAPQAIIDYNSVCCLISRFDKHDT